MVLLCLVGLLLPLLSTGVIISSNAQGSHSKRVKRDTSEDTICESDVPLFTVNKFTIPSETNNNIQPVFLDNEGKEILLLTYGLKIVNSTFRSSKIYKSADYGKSYKLVYSFNEENPLTEPLIVNPLDKRKILAATREGRLFAQKTVLFISNDSGDTWNKITTNLTMSTISLHPKVSEWLLAETEDTLQILTGTKRVLVFSPDFGKTWRRVATDTTSQEWGCDMWSGKNETLFISSRSQEGGVSGDRLALYRIDDIHKVNWERWTGVQLVLPDITSFHISGKFLLITKNLRTDKGDMREIWVSIDRGYTINPVRNMPQLDHEKYFSLLDASAGRIMLHADNNDTADNLKKGVLYRSDGSGTNYAVSLENHGYGTIETNSFFFSQTRRVYDFVTVRSMRGTYLTAQVDSSARYQSVISHNYGGSWTKIPAPKEDDCKLPDCSLHVHFKISEANGISVQSPLSSERAAGIILVHAQAGSYHYLIADHGSLLVAVERAEDGSIAQTNKVKFSTNEGQCWFEQSFVSEEDGFVPFGVISVPESTNARVSVWGKNREQEWQVFEIDFESILTRQCSEQDYEEWEPNVRGEEKGCNLGYQEIFKKKKPQSYSCLNGPSFDVQIQRKVYPCMCREEDFECDYGYELNDGVCKPKPGFQMNKSWFCTADTDWYNISTGYRKVPQDLCTCGYEKSYTPGTKQSCKWWTTKSSLTEKIKPTDELDCQITEFLPGWKADLALSDEVSTVNGIIDHVNSLATNMTSRNDASEKNHTFSKVMLSLVCIGALFGAFVLFLKRRKALRERPISTALSQMILADGEEDEGPDDDDTPILL